MWSYHYTDYSNDFLAHHGIKGQKWGVRRYQNADGSYTQAGLRRYNQMYNKRVEAEKKYNDAKVSGASEIETSNLKRDVKLAKLNEKNAYKHLKNDSKADKGKKLYAQGNTVTGLQRKHGITGAAMGLIGAGLGYAAQQLNEKGNKKAATALLAGSLASSAVGLVLNAVGSVKIDQLRAYYGHQGFKEIKRN